MHAEDIQPGLEYGRARSGFLPDRVTVTSVTPTRVFYVDEHGRRGHARPGDITGPWAAHEAALRRAENARDTLLAAAGDRIASARLGYRDDWAAVAEDDEYGVLVELSTPQAIDPPNGGSGALAGVLVGGTSANNVGDRM